MGCGKLQKGVVLAFFQKLIFFLVHFYRGQIFGMHN